MTDSTDNARGPELLPCPFCGNDGSKSRLDVCSSSTRHAGWEFTVECTNCGAEGAYAASGFQARRKWNARADLAPEPLRAVKVRALEWTQYCSNAGNSSAPAFGGEYICERAGDDGNYGLWIPLDGPADDPRGYYEELAAAKAAAQTDYETRIRSALEPDQQDARVARLRELLEEFARQNTTEELKRASLHNGDYEYSHDTFIRKSRAVLAAFDKGGKDE